MNFILAIFSIITLLLLSTVSFIDGVERVAVRLGLTRFATGALLAAFLTALPETIIALLSRISGGPASLDIGAGSILAAPSITILLGAPLVILAPRSRGLNVGVARNYLLFSFILLPSMLMLLFLKVLALRYTLAVGLMILYIQLAKGIYHAEDEFMEGRSRTIIEKAFRTRSMVLAVFQVLVSLGLMVFAADSFIDELAAHADALSYSLVLSPFGTCLPEVLTASYWTLKRKSDMALSLLSGENLMQATLVLGIGILSTDMQLPISSLSIVVIYSLAAVMLFIGLRRNIGLLIGVPIIALYPVYMIVALNL
ncbi:MAG: hypothetical protein QXJ88_03030 [Nitrososphaerota archaeon]